MANQAWKRFLKHRLAILGLTVLVVISLAAVFAAFVAPYHATRQDLTQTNMPPSKQHLLGTDSFGRDVLTRIIWGSRVSLMIGFLSMGLATVLGTALGIIAGYYRGSADWAIMRFTDMFYSLPALFVILILVAVFGPGIWMTVVAIGVVYWPATARIVRAEFMRLQSEPFVEAAQALGASPWRQITRHFMPNALAPLLVQMSLQLARAIVLESGLSYLGLGAQAPTASWGNILSEGHINLRFAPWIATFAGIAIWITTISFNFVGDALRDSLDPTLARRR